MLKTKLRDPAWAFQLKVIRWAVMSSVLFWAIVYRVGTQGAGLPQFVYVNF